MLPEKYHLCDYNLPATRGGEEVSNASRRIGGAGAGNRTAALLRQSGRTAHGLNLHVGMVHSPKARRNASQYNTFASQAARAAV